MTDPREDHDVRAECNEILSEMKDLESDASDFEARAKRTRARLGKLWAALDDELTEALDADDLERAKAIRDISKRITVLRMHVDQRLINEADKAPRVVDAIERIDVINDNLQKTADQAEEAAAKLDQVTGVLTQLVKLIDNFEALA